MAYPRVVQKNDHVVLQSLRASPLARQSVDEATLAEKIGFDLKTGQAESSKVASNIPSVSWPNQDNGQTIKELNWLDRGSTLEIKSRQRINHRIYGK